MCTRRRWLTGRFCGARVRECMCISGECVVIPPSWSCWHARRTQPSCRPRPRSPPRRRRGLAGWAARRPPRPRAAACPAAARLGRVSGADDTFLALLLALELHLPAQGLDLVLLGRPLRGDCVARAGVSSSVCRIRCFTIAEAFSFFSFFFFSPFRLRLRHGAINAQREARRTCHRPPVTVPGRWGARRSGSSGALGTEEQVCVLHRAAPCVGGASLPVSYGKKTKSALDEKDLLRLSGGSLCWSSRTMRHISAR